MFEDLVSEIVFDSFLFLEIVKSQIIDILQCSQPALSVFVTDLQGCFIEAVQCELIVAVIAQFFDQLL